MNKISGNAALAIVVANMIGTGVFTSLGFQLVSSNNTWSIILLWLIGAVMALCGAFVYAELGTVFKRSGGEYHFLSEIYGKQVGYLAGWTSLTVGFAAPVALAAMAVGEYTESYIGGAAKIIAIAVVLVISALHMFDTQKSSHFQKTTTFIKVAIVIALIACGLLLPSTESGLDWSASWTEEVLMPSFAVSLVYVSYSFSGWNAAAYITDEIKDVKRNLPLALVGGTLFVSLLYILLQVIFLKHASVDQLAGEVEVGKIVAINLFGDNGGQLVSYLIAFMLISSISAMIWVGPRVTRTMGEDYKLWSYFSSTNNNQVPVRAIILQSLISVVMIITGSFEQILIYSGLILQLFVVLTVIGSFIVRQRNIQSVYRTPGYPLPQVIYSILGCWILIYLMKESFWESMVGLGIIAAGSVSYWLNQKLESKTLSESSSLS